MIRWPFSVCFWVQAVGEADSQEVKPGTASWGPRVVLSPGCTPSSCQTLARAVDLISVLQWSSMSPCPVPVPGQHSAWPSSSSTREWTWCPEVKGGGQKELWAFTHRLRFLSLLCGVTLGRLPLCPQLEDGNDNREVRKCTKPPSQGPSREVGIAVILAI